VPNPSLYYRRARAEGFGFYYDPLYGYIPLSPLLRQAIDLPEVQRLRRLKQLAVLSLVFPGATHTRFAHSIGLSYLCEVEWINFIRWKEQTNLDLELSPYHLLALQLAAIFHDIGHGPFSHIFEMFCKRYQRYKEYKHEQITRRLITEGIGDYDNIPGFLEDLRKMYQERGVSSGALELLTPDSIANLIEGNPPVGETYEEYAFLGQLLNSPYDIDRIDYLRRDAYYTGVETGSVDVWEIIHSFLIYRDKPKEVWMLGIDIKAAEAVEALLEARNLAYRKVYYNQTHRSNQELIIRAILDLIDSKRGDIELLILKDDYDIIKEFEESPSIFTQEVAKRLKERRLYEPLPIKLNSNIDLDEMARTRRVDLWKKEYQNVMNEEERLSNDFGIWPRNTVIFDYELVPLAEDEDYTERYLFDITTEKNVSLLEALPHLELIYGEYRLPGIRYSIGELYRQKLSNFFVYVPYNLIENVLQSIIKRLQVMEISKNEHDLSSFIECECTDILDPFHQIGRSFTSLVGIVRDQQKELLKRFTSQIVSYLSRLIVV